LPKKLIPLSKTIYRETRTIYIRPIYNIHKFYLINYFFQKYAPQAPYACPSSIASKGACSQIRISNTPFPSPTTYAVHYKVSNGSFNITGTNIRTFKFPPFNLDGELR